MMDERQEQLARSIEAVAARVDALAANLSFACETPAIAALLQRKAAIEADIAAGEEQLAALSQQAAAAAQRETALDARERQIKIREFQFDQKVEEAMGQLRASYASLTQASESMRIRVLNYAGMLDGFELGIRELPSWDSIERMMGVTDAIPEMQPQANTREGWGGDKFSDQSTLTRSMPKMTPAAELDAMPMPANKPADASARARRKAARRAAHP